MLFVVGISGTTCSGKTTLAKSLLKTFPKAHYINQDEYFLPIDHKNHVFIPKLKHNNWELLSSLDMEKLLQDVQDKLKDDSSSNCNLLIIEGFSLFNYKPLYEYLNLKFYITLTKEQCWERRQNRSYDPPDVPGYFEQIVWPQSEIYKKEIIHDKSIIFFDGTDKSENILFQVTSKIKENLQ